MEVESAVPAGRCRLNELPCMPYITGKVLTFIRTPSLNDLYVFTPLRVSTERMEGVREEEEKETTTNHTPEETREMKVTFYVNPLISYTT
jgi:hypothetical protein